MTTQNENSPLTHHAGGQELKTDAARRLSRVDIVRSRDIFRHGGKA